MAQQAGTLSGPAINWGVPSYYSKPAHHGPTAMLGPPQTAAGPTGAPQGMPTPGSSGSPFLAGGLPAGHTGAVDPNIINSMGQYQDAAYNNQTSRLDPYWKQQQDAFDQKMVGQGIMPGSQAYNNAKATFDAGRNDAYTGAYNNSFQTGLAAQNQGFNQGYQYDALANALQIAGMNEAGQLGSAGIGANASMYNNDANNQTNQLLGLGNLGLSYGNQQMQQGQNSFQDLMAMFGMGQGQDQYNNQLIGSSYDTLFGMIPNSNPAPVDVNGAYGINQSGANAAYAGKQASANGTNQMIGTALSVVAMFL